MSFRAERGEFSTLNDGGERGMLIPKGLHQHFPSREGLGVCEITSTSVLSQTTHLKQGDGYYRTDYQGMACSMTLSTLGMPVITSSSSKRSTFKPMLSKYDCLRSSLTIVASK